VYELEKSAVPDWQSTQNWWFPTAVNTNCPFCAVLASFTPQSITYDNNRKTLGATSKCPSCGETVYFWVINPGPANDSSKRGDGTLAIFPAPQRPRQPIEGENLMPARIRKAYHGCLGVYNAGVWSATATLCRRTLEGIVADLLPEPERKGGLAEQLNKLSESVDLSKPLITLSEALRQGGNIGAHFDLDKEPDQETAQAMLDLIEYLLEYVYTLPKMVQALNQRLTALSKKHSGNSN